VTTAIRHQCSAGPAWELVRIPVTYKKSLFPICLIITSTDYGGDSTAPRTAQRTTMPSYLFPSTPVRAYSGLLDSFREAHHRLAIFSTILRLAVSLARTARAGTLAGFSFS
jgi:hypothetical protein